MERNVKAERMREEGKRPDEEGKANRSSKLRPGAPKVHPSLHEWGTEVTL